MHKTEGENHDGNEFTNGPPGTRAEENWLNAVQNEIVNAILGANNSILTASTETGTQLLTAILKLIDFGQLIRPTFTYKDTDEIYLGAGSYIHCGTTTQKLYWDHTLTFKFGSGGSNSDSENLSTSEWHYIYIDDSAVISADSLVLTVAEFINTTTEPTYNDSKKGWYNGNDRCVFAVKTDGSSQIISFHHDGRDYVEWAAQQTIISAATPSNTWTDADASGLIPKFCKRGMIFFEPKYVDAGAVLEWRFDGEAASIHRVASVASTSTRQINTIQLYLDGVQVFEYRFDVATANTIDIRVDGYYLPSGL